MIIVEQLGPEEWKVAVEASTRTEHTVRVPVAYVQELFPQAAPPIPQLLEASFQFLLEREPNTAILRTFKLPDIARYFPEFPRDIRRLAKS